MMKFRTCLLLLTTLVYSSCKVSKALSMIERTTVNEQIWTNGEKTVIFLPMAHIGKQKFYDNVKSIIDSLKQKQFIVIYEGTRMDPINDSLKITAYKWLMSNRNLKHYYRDTTNVDSIVKDIYERKFRRLVGFYLDSTGYAQHFKKTPFLKNMVDQPRPHQMGLDSNDIRVDVPKNLLVDIYEQKFGKINMEQIDFAIPLDPMASYPSSLKLPSKNVEEIIINYRNSNLAHYIHSSSAKKILVIYGAIHVNGTFEELTKRDERWKQ